MTRSLTTADLLDINLRRVLIMLHRAKGELTRVDLARELGMSRATVASVVSILVEQKIITEEPASPSNRRGRPTTCLVPAKTGPAAVAVELESGHMTIADIGIGGRILRQEHQKLTRRDPKYVVKYLTERVREHIKTLGNRCKGVGVSVHGLVNNRSGVVALAPNLGWENVPLGAKLRSSVGTSVVVDNDTTLSALAEATHGNSQHTSNLLYVSSDVGVGGGLIVNGKIFRGSRGYGLEVGHVPLGRGTLKCRCGGQGCWETQIDQIALARAAGKRATPVNAEKIAAEIFSRAAGGDGVSQQAINQTAHLLGQGLGKLINIFDPAIIVLGRLAANLHQAAPAVVEAAMRSSTLSAHLTDMPKVVSEAVNRAALTGAADAVFDNWLSPAGFGVGASAGQEALVGFPLADPET